MMILYRRQRRNGEEERRPRRPETPDFGVLHVDHD